MNKKKLMKKLNTIRIKRDKIIGLGKCKHNAKEHVEIIHIYQSYIDGIKRYRELLESLSTSPILGNDIISSLQQIFR